MNVVQAIKRNGRQGRPADMACAGERSSPRQNSFGNSLYKTLDSLQRWANPTGNACGGNIEDSNIVVFENGNVSAGIGELGEDSKTYEDGSFLNALRCNARDLSEAAAGRGFICSAGSDDFSCSSEDDQLRRFGSWGTFGTLGTNESIESNAEASAKCRFDDDGNLIDPFLLEKAKQNRERFRVKTRAVKFAYPPISSLKQCPRIDPDDLDILFFSSEELNTYEHDRRSTGAADDVEIVAVSTSFSDDAPPPPTAITASPQPSSASARSNSSLDWSHKSGLAKYIPSPKYSRRALAENQEARGRASQTAVKSKRRGSPGPPKVNLQMKDLNARINEPESASDLGVHKEKRLLKSVQIFLRARSTGK